jgi:hypothetical protein
LKCLQDVTETHTDVKPTSRHAPSR